MVTTAAKIDVSTIISLVVDDQDPMRKAFSRILQQIGVPVILECVDVADSIKVLTSQPVNFVICDFYLRTKQGNKILEFIRNRDVFQDIPVLMISGEDARDQIIKMVSEGADDFIMKPFQVSDVEKKILIHLTSYLKPNELQLQVRQGDQCLMKKDFAGALKFYEAAEKIDPKSSKAILNSGMALSRLKKYTEAKAKWERGIKLAPEYYKFYRSLTDQAIQLGEHEEAINWLDEELKINPKQQVRQTLIANLLLSQSKPERALEHLKIALREEPNFFKALMTTARAFAFTGNTAKAIHYFLRARRSDPKSSEPLQAVMEMYYRSNEPQRVEHLLKDEKKSYPNRHDIYILLAQHYVKEKRIQEAEITLKELLIRDKENEAARALLSKIQSQGRLAS